MTLLLSSSICSTMAASGGELTEATVAAPDGAVPVYGPPATVMPSAVRKSPNDSAATAAGSLDRAR